jgi:hypothetical protein
MVKILFDKFEFEVIMLGCIRTLVGRWNLYLNRFTELTSHNENRFPHFEKTLILGRSYRTPETLSVLQLLHALYEKSCTSSLTQEEQMNLHRPRG